MTLTTSNGSGSVINQTNSQRPDGSNLSRFTFSDVIAGKTLTFTTSGGNKNFAFTEVAVGC